MRRPTNDEGPALGKPVSSSSIELMSWAASVTLVVAIVIEKPKATDTNAMVIPVVGTSVGSKDGIFVGSKDGTGDGSQLV